MHEDTVRQLARPMVIGFSVLCGVVGLLLILIFLECTILDSNYVLVTYWVLALLAIGSIAFLIFTWQKRENAHRQQYQTLLATLEAISRSQAIIEFDVNGIILSANDKFLDAMGYRLEEIIGKKHRMFVEGTYANTEEYRNFWTRLRQGDYQQSEFKRVGKHNKEVWLLSSYNPILNTKGEVTKIIKVATDITETKQQQVELERLTQHLSRMGEQIKQEVKRILDGMHQLEGTVSEQVSSATEQATAVTQISTTIEEIKATTNQTLSKAKHLGESAALTTKEGEKGRHAIEKMIESMDVLQEKMQQISNTILSLNDKTQQIGEITNVVSDIAKQSKMLALNASIEAAKAGESGKGFAVVAGEVKDLAERSQQSTERVHKILQDIRHTAEHAVMVAEDGTKTVDDHIEEVKHTGEIINSLGQVIEETSLSSMQIVSAVREEAVAIDQVDLSIKEINKVTSNFTATTEQTKNAIVSLGQVSTSLNEAVSAYKIKGSLQDKAAE